jgi:hypothetical protein
VAGGACLIISVGGLGLAWWAGNAIGGAAGDVLFPETVAVPDAQPQILPDGVGIPQVMPAPEPLPSGSDGNEPPNPSGSRGTALKVGIAGGITTLLLTSSQFECPAPDPTPTTQAPRPPTRTVLIVGEHQPFEYALGLAARHPDWDIIASTYGNGSNTQNVRSTRGNLTIVDNVDARRLERGSYTATRRFDDIIFNAPRATTKPFYGATEKLIDRFLASALAVLKSGGAARLSSSDGMPGGYRLNYLVNNRPLGYIRSFKVFYEGDVRFNVPYNIQRNDGSLLYPLGKFKPQIYWFAFQKG